MKFLKTIEGRAKIAIDTAIYEHFRLWRLSMLIELDDRLEYLKINFRI